MRAAIRWNTNHWNRIKGGLGTTNVGSFEKKLLNWTIFQLTLVLPT